MQQSKIMRIGKFTAREMPNPLMDEAWRVLLPNGYGVSLIRGDGAKSNAQTFEVGVLRAGVVSYDTGITVDVLAYQTMDEIVEILTTLESFEDVPLSEALEWLSAAVDRELSMWCEIKELEHVVETQKDVLYWYLGPETRRQNKIFKAGFGKKIWWWLVAATPMLAASAVVTAAILWKYDVDLWVTMMILSSGALVGIGIEQGFAAVMNGGPRDKKQGV